MKMKMENNYGQNNHQSYGLDSLLKADEKTIRDEIENIEHQIAEREKIKQRNLRFLEWQREKLEELINRSNCYGYAVMGGNEIRNRLTTQLVQVELRKGEEYVNAFRDVQRLEEQKRKLMRETGEDEGWLKY
jgi:50S ribosomal subunit-associated GTPase HflX